MIGFKFFISISVMGLFFLVRVINIIFKKFNGVILIKFLVFDLLSGSNCVFYVYFDVIFEVWILVFFYEWNLRILDILIIKKIFIGVFCKY